MLGDEVGVGDGDRLGQAGGAGGEEQHGGRRLRGRGRVEAEPGGGAVVEEGAP